MKITNTFILFMAFCSTLSLVSCNKIEDILDEVRNDREERAEVRTSAASYPEVVTFSSSSSSDKGVVYEVLPDPAALDPSQSPTPFSNRVAIAGGSYDYKAVNRTEEDSEESKDNVPDFYCRFERADGTVFSIDKIKVIHKEEGTGEHTFFGGIGFDKTIHGNTGVGTNLEPKLLAYVALWGMADLKDGAGNIIASDRFIHVMTTSRVRTEDLRMITDRETDQTDHSPDKVETHVIIPPTNLQGGMDPVPGTGHGFLHLMFEEVSLK